MDIFDKLSRGRSEYIRMKLKNKGFCLNAAAERTLRKWFASCKVSHFNYKDHR